MIGVFGQNGLIGDGFESNWSTIANFNTSTGTSRIYTTTPYGSSTGDKYFRLVRNWGGDTTQFGPSDCGDVNWTNPGITYGASTCSSGAFFINVPNLTDNYIFKTPNGNTATTLLYFRVQGAVQTVSSVTQSPSTSTINNTNTVIVTANLSGAFATGQVAYLR